MMIMYKLSQENKHEYRGENEMNEVKRFSAGSMRRLESAINCFALEHEIINVSLAYNQNNKYGEYNALVLYKQK